MEIVKITAENFGRYRDDLIALGDEFLVDVCEEEPRSNAESEAVYRSMIDASANTTLLLAVGDDGEAIGFSYYNFGTGYSCGGSYLWLNGIYIRPSHQQRGFGSKLLEYIEVDGRRNHGIKLFICSRAPENAASRKLFARAGFAQHPSTGMEKVWS